MNSQLESDPVRSSIKSWLAKTEKNLSAKWVVCPICKEEWTKLRPCRFLWEKRWNTVYFCVQCAETTKSIPEIAGQYPILEVTIKTGFIGPRQATSEIGGKKEVETLWRNQYALFTFVNLTIGLTATDSGKMFLKVGEENVRPVDNVMDGWSVIKRTIDEFRMP